MHLCARACDCIHACACACYQWIQLLSFFFFFWPDSMKVSYWQRGDSFVSLHLQFTKCQYRSLNSSRLYRWCRGCSSKLQCCMALSRKRSPKWRKRRRKRRENNQTRFTSSSCISATMLWQSAGRYTLTVTHLASWHWRALLHLGHQKVWLAS